MTKKVLAWGMGLALCALVMAPVAFAQGNLNLKGELGTVGSGIYGSEPKPLTETIGSVIATILTFLGVIMVVIVIYAGFLYMTAGGNEDKTKEAKKWILNSIIGLALILLAYSITTFVIEKLGDATGVSTG